MYYRSTQSAEALARRIDQYNVTHRSVQARDSREAMIVFTLIVLVLIVLAPVINSWLENSFSKVRFDLLSSNQPITVAEVAQETELSDSPVSVKGWIQ